MTNNTDYMSVIRRIAELQLEAAHCTRHDQAIKLLTEAAMLQSLTQHPPITDTAEL